jgi:hypothetical protein
MIELAGPVLDRWRLTNKIIVVSKDGGLILGFLGGGI